MKINLKLDTKQHKKQGHPLVLSVYVSKTDRKYRYTGFFATAEQWDLKKEEPKKNHPLYIGIMSFILEIKGKINDLINSRQRLTAEQILNKLFRVSESFYDFWEERISEIKNDGTKAAYRISLNEFRKFRNDLAFNEIDYNFLTSFKNWKKNTCSNNGINTYLKNIRAVYNEAVRRGVYVPDSFVSPFYKIMERAEKTKDKYLTLEEIRLIAKNPNKTKYDHYFLLCFLLGGADFIDIAKLKHSDILRGRIRFRRNKGGTNEIIDNKIFPETEEILNYFGEKEFLTDIYKFSLKTCRDNYIKRYRKQLQEQGVSSYVSSKSARYTFINIGKELLLNREILMELTGHSRGDVHSIYEGKFSNQIKDEVHEKIIKAVFE